MAPKSNSAKQEVLLDKIGGTQVLRAAVDDFYDRLVQDEELQPFFEGVNMKLLRWHQYNIMTIAFTDVPDGIDIAAVIKDKHKNLVANGLTEHHFDVFTSHFVTSLEHVGVKQAEIDEAIGVIEPLRVVFVEAAIEAEKEKQRKLMMRITILIALLAIAIYFYMEKIKV
jgi:hemoglobin